MKKRNLKMKHSDFSIGCEFMTEAGRWRCTDVGTRIVAAIRLNHDDDPSWYNEPPYAVVEHVFDEYDFEGCTRARKKGRFDDSGRSEIAIVPRSALQDRSKRAD